MNYSSTLLVKRFVQKKTFSSGMNPWLCPTTSFTIPYFSPLF